MSIAKISGALEARLALLMPAIQTAYENMATNTTVGTPYQRVNILPAQTDMPGVDLVTKHERGIFQVSLCYPLNAGRGAAQTRAELLRAHFPAGLRLTQGGVTVQIDQPPSIGPGMPGTDVYMVPVSIRYRAFTL